MTRSTCLAAAEGLPADFWKSPGGTRPGGAGVLGAMEVYNRQMHYSPTGIHDWIAVESKLMPSSTFGRYEIKAELGRGGMATVYRAHDPRFGRDVAIKVLPREFLHDPKFQTRFGREAQAIAALEHPNIVPVYDYGEEQGQPFLVMRYMAGGSLADRMKAGPLPLEEVSRIIDRLAPALDEAHLNGIIHRDLKPGNILFDRRGDPTLSDFGIAKLVEETATLTGSAIIGTPAYMSPEQAVGSGELDSRSDIYSLGVILFQMLTGRLPYEADGMVHLIYKHVNEPVPSLRKLAPRLPRACDKIVARAMAKNPDDRFLTARTLADALRACGESRAAEQIETIREKRPSGDLGALFTLQESAETSDAAERETRLPAPGRRLSRQGLVVGLVLVIGFLGAVVGIAYFILLDRDASGRPAVVAPSATAIPTMTAQPTPTRQATPNPAAIAATLPSPSTPVPSPTPSPKGPPAISVSNVQRIAPVRALEGQVALVRSMEISPDGLLLATASGSYGYLYDEKRILIWSVLDGALLRSLEGHSAVVSSVSFSPDGSQLASGSYDGTIRVWDVDSGDEMEVLTGHQAGVSSLAWSPAGPKLASGGIDTTIRLWDLAQSNAMRTLIDTRSDLPYTPDWPAYQVAWSPDGDMLASAGPGVYMHVWDAATGSELLRVPVDGTSAYEVAWSPDGEELASGGYAGKVRIWDVESGALLQELDVGGSFLRGNPWSPDGTLFATTSDAGVILWDTANWDSVHVIESTGAGSLAWSPDQTMLAIAGYDGTVQLWSINP
jgi:serine/threonine-protein kinase